MADIEVDHITKKFGDFTAVDGISFSVEHGEIFALPAEGLVTTAQFNAYAVLRPKRLLLTKAALEELRNKKK